MPAEDSQNHETESVDLKTPVTWVDLDLKIAILGILNSYRRKDAWNGGSTLANLNFLLYYFPVKDIENAADWLEKQRLIARHRTHEDVLQISVSGVDFLAEQHGINKRQLQDQPTAKRRGPGSSGLSGWWGPSPPRPDDKSGVRKKPYPSSGAGEIALPQPEPPPNWL